MASQAPPENVSMAAEEDGEFDVLLSYQAVEKMIHFTHDMTVVLVTSARQEPLTLRFENVEDPSTEMVLQARLKHAKKKMFDYVQELQKKDRATRQAMYAEIKSLDQYIDQDMDKVRLVKDKAVRSQLMDGMYEFKQLVAKIYNIMTKDTHEQIDNLLIAQLNDAAYKAIRKAGLQKKLDERAMKNEDLFKKLDAQLAEAVAKVDFDKLRANQGELIAKLGTCFMSQCDVTELMEQKDVMCIGLKIKRSEAVIADPTKLVITEVLPVYISLDSFLESSLFKLKMNSDAAGGFDLKQEGVLAIGAGREEISGVLPLFLFRDHWDLVRRKMQSLLGFMCTLDPLGYASNQYFTIPFLVLAKIYQQNLENPSEANQQLYDLVFDTCKHMVSSNATFREQIVDQLLAFVADPINRGQDVIADLKTFNMQIFTWLSLPDEERQVVNNDPQAAGEPKDATVEQRRRFSRFCLEESMRRKQKRDAQPLTKNQILSQVCPGFQQIVTDYTTQYKAYLEKKAAGGADAGDKYAAYRAVADRLRAEARSQEEEKKDDDDASAEEAKGGEQAQAQANDGLPSIEKIVNDQIAKAPWMAKVDAGIAGAEKMAVHKTLMAMLSFFDGLESRSYERILELFGDEKEILFAVCLQNALHPKNSQRTQAVKDGKYVEIETLEQAREFLADLIRVNLTNDLKGAESKVVSMLQELQAAADVKMLIEAPDVYIAAAALSSIEFYNGRGDRTTFFKTVLELNPGSIPDLGNKLGLVVKNEFMGLKLYNDKLCHVDQVNKKTVYRLWLHCCRINGAVTLEQMIAFQPMHKDLLKRYDKFVDAEGKTTLNIEEQLAFRAEAAAKAEAAKKQKAAKKAGKLKL